jgi:Tol biopolymer transport system component
MRQTRRRSIRGRPIRGVLLLEAAFALVALLFVSAAGARSISHGLQGGLRILYASDWTGTMEIFAADPSGRAPLGQLTFARAEGACYSPAACGYARPQPSPDGRWLVYWSIGSLGSPSMLWLARADGTRARMVGEGLDAVDAVWRPDSRLLAYSAADGIHLLTVSGSDRIVLRASAGALGWSPDGKTLAFMAGETLSLYRGGRVSSLVSSAGTGGTLLAFAWSPDGRMIAYSTREGVFVARVGGRRSNGRRVYRQAVASPGCWSDVGLPESELAFSPNGRRLAFDLDGTPGVLDTHGWHARSFHDRGRHLSWSPDGRSLLFVQGCQDASDELMTSGDVQAISVTGHIRTLVSAARSYGGQIVSAAWTMPPSSVRYRRAQPVTGVFAGGPVQKLAADAGRLAYASCGRISTWTADTGATVQIEGRADECWSARARPAHVGSLAIADDRVLWWWADLGLGFRWSMREATIGAPPVDLADGFGNLGATPGDGTGTAVGSGSLLAMSSWRLRGTVVDQQTVARVDPGGCPCPGISTSPGPYTPLDVDQGRIVVSGTNETRIVSSDGTVLLSVPVSTLAAQLDGSQLVIAAGNELQVYDARNGALKASWPMPAVPVGHDCDIFADPSCNYGAAPAQVTLEDVAHDLAAYVYAGQVRLLRLSDGADRVVADGTLARFMNAGLVYANGARIWFTPYDQLPLSGSSTR